MLNCMSCKMAVTKNVNMFLVKMLSVIIQYLLGVKPSLRRL